MKLIIRDNSVGLRLMRGEVDTLREKGLITASTQFPGGRTLRYSLESSPASVNPAAFFSEGEIIVRLPETAVLAWATSDQVSIGGDQVLVDGMKLNILVEKDFVGPRGRDDKDESDTSPRLEADEASR